jgi:hypothetical protein
MFTKVQRCTATWNLFPEKDVEVDPSIFRSQHEESQKFIVEL